MPDFILAHLFYLALCLIIGGFLGWALLAARRADARRTAAGDLLFRPTRPVRLLVAVAYAIPIVAVVMLAIFPPKPADIVPATGSLTMFLLLGAGLHWMLRRTICVAGEAGIFMPSVWTRRRFYTWDQVQRVETNMGSAAMIFYTDDDRKWDIPSILEGHPALLALARRHIQPERFLDMQASIPLSSVATGDLTGVVERGRQARRQADARREDWLRRQKRP